MLRGAVHSRLPRRLDARRADPDWLTSVLGAGVTVDAAEEHHGGVPDGTPQTEVTVTAISAVHCRHSPTPGQDQRMLPALTTSTPGPLHRARNVWI
jgi:hypothetical protein